MSQYSATSLEDLDFELSGGADDIPNCGPNKDTANLSPDDKENIMRKIAEDSGNVAAATESGDTLDSKWNELMKSKDEKDKEPKEQTLIYPGVYQKGDVHCQNVFESSEFKKIEEALKDIKISGYMFNGSSYQEYNGSAKDLLKNMIPPSMCVLEQTQFNEFKKKHLKDDDKEPGLLGGLLDGLFGGNIQQQIETPLPSKKSNYTRYQKLKAKYLALKNK